jgi:energy-coupling factor transport system ATP-binding protein
MRTDLAIQADGVAKQYQLGRLQGGYDLLSERFASLFKRDANGKRRERLWALEDVSFEVAHGETFGILGRNGAGKSTLLRAAAGLLRPVRGRVESAGEVALLLQSPSDYLVHERVRDELPAAVARDALRELDLLQAGERDPRDLSGGERQRLALAIVLAGRGIGGGEPCSVVALDEPTRGLDRRQKAALAGRLRRLAERGAAIVCATHDVEFAAGLAGRCVLLGRGTVMADGPTSEVLSGGRYFATEVARVLWPATGVVLPEDGAARLRSAASEEAIPA